MKLISCHIENFGGLSDYDLSFADGLTVLQQPNGFGKTTLAEFIRAMFYGFPRRAKTLDKSKRQKYMPWNGQKCGGNLVFETDGKRYRLERTFGAMPKSDTFNLIDLQTGKKSSRFTEQIGIELFQLDSESFERSTYIPQSRDSGSLTTASIQAKLGDLVEDTNDINNFDKAMAALRTKRSGFVPYRGNGGSVAEAVSRISDLQGQLDDLQRRQVHLAQTAEEITALQDAQEKNEAELAVLRQQIREAESAAACSAYKEQYRVMETELTKAAAELNSLRERYPGGIPGVEDVKAAQPAFDRYGVLAAQRIETQADAEAKDWLKANESRFRDALPTEAELAQWDNCRAMYHRAVTERENCRLPERDERKLAQLDERFAQGVPSPRMLQDADEKQERIESLLRENDSLNTQPAVQPPRKKNGIAIATALVAGIALIILGAMQLAGGNLIAGCAMLAVGTLGILTGGYLAVDRLISSRMAHAGTDARTLARIQENREEAARLESENARLLSRYGTDNLAMLCRDVQEYVALTDLRREMEDKKEELGDAAAAWREKCSAALERYYPQVLPEQFDRLLAQLRWDTAQYSRHTAQLKDWQQRHKNHRQELSACRETMETFCKAFGLRPENSQQLRRIWEDARRAEDLQTQLTDLQRKKEAYYQTRREELETATDQVCDLEGLRRRESSLQAGYVELADRLANLKYNLSQLRQAVDRIPDLEDELCNWQNRRTEDLERKQLLDDTMDFLQQARDSLTGNYLGPIQSRFACYMDQLSGQTGEKVLISSELEVQVERQGQARELGYFSAGQTDLVMLCMRFALIDALFTEEKPFVILDDPFVNLDDRHTELALILLKELAQNRQIIYLVCHSSRA